MFTIRRLVAVVSLVLAGGVGAVWGTEDPVEPPFEDTEEVFGATGGADEAHGASIVFEISGLRSDRGRVLGALFSSERTWPQEGREIATCRGSISGRHAACVIEDIAPGTYAFAFLHDEDGNGSLNRNFIGIPEEGYGFSNDASPGLGPPSFRSASFDHGADGTVMHLRTRYGI